MIALISKPKATGVKRCSASISVWVRLKENKGNFHGEENRRASARNALSVSGGHQQARLIAHGGGLCSGRFNQDPKQKAAPAVAAAFPEAQ
ncbi:hypothetical protein ACU4GD_35035 [Cupriavidus basilensis]